MVKLFRSDPPTPSDCAIPQQRFTSIFEPSSELSSRKVDKPDLIRWAIERCDEPKVLRARPRNAASSESETPLEFSASLKIEPESWRILSALINPECFNRGPGVSFRRKRDLFPPVVIRFPG
jgi:hypothetical protein